ncbi:MAG: DegT/DnrJ/EryC1/StrS family aminotransferase [Candidatus Helarchaeota archaeon]
MKIPLFKNYSDEKEVKNVENVLKRGMYWANGPEIKEFEDRISEFIGMKYCVAFNSGTSALHALLTTYNVKGKEVIVPSFTFISTANSVLHAGGIPIFADIETETFGLDPDSINEKITKNTVALMPIHYGGCGCKIREIKEIARDNKLLLIEDAAESLGAEINGKKIGTFGDATMFSFTPTKIISTGEGGVIVTDSRDTFEKLKLVRSHGRLETEDYFSSIKFMDYIMLGYNFRMPTICAAVGLAQLDKIKEIINLRREIVAYYNKELKNINEIRCPITPKNYFHIYQMYSILINDGKKVRDELQAHLKEGGISSKVYFYPAHQTHFYSKVLRYSIKLEKTEEISDKILSIPIYPTLSRNEREYIIKKILDFFRKN